MMEMCSLSLSLYLPGLIARINARDFHNQLTWTINEIGEIYHLLLVANIDNSQQCVVVLEGAGERERR